MKIRAYQSSDFEAIRRMHHESGLPSNCFPPLNDARTVVKITATDDDGRIVQAGFVKLIGEAFVLLDHSFANPGERLEVLSTLVAHGLAKSSQYVDSVSAWLPPEVEKAFGERLQAMGWLRSPWQSYSVLLR